MAPQLQRCFPSLLVAIVLGLSYGEAHCYGEAHSEPVRPAEALSLIVDVGRKICYDPPLMGSSRRYTAKVFASEKGEKNPSLWSMSENYGVSAADLLTVEKNNLECRLAVLQKLIDKILPVPALGNIDPSPITIEDPGAFVTDFMNSMCFFRLGMVDMTIQGKCASDSCSIQYQATSSYSDKTIYVTPQFKVIFPDQFQGSQSNPRTESGTREWPPSPSGKRVMVESKITTTALLDNNASLLSECIEKVGNSVLDRFRLYDSGSMLSRLPKDRQSSYGLIESTLPELDLSVLQIWLPKSIKSGYSFGLEARLIPSSVLQAERADLDPHKLDEEARTNFQDLEQGIVAAPSNHTKPNIPTRLEYEFELSNYHTLKLEARKNGIEAASLKMNGDDLTARALSVERQAMKPFKAGVWSWDIKPLGAGEHAAYLSIEAKRADGNVISSVVPLQFVVEQSILESVKSFFSTNWQWIAGTLVIPFVIFVWGRVGGKRLGSSSTTQQPAPEKRSQNKRRETRRQR